MAPKRGTGRKAPEAESAAQPHAVFRPATPNDYRIVATVKHLQELANTETKWRNRLTTASREQIEARSKIERVHQLIELCEKGVAQCRAAVEAAIDEQFNMVCLDPAQVNAWQHGAHALLPGTSLTCAPKALPASDTKSKALATKSAPGALRGGASHHADSTNSSIFPPGYTAEAEPSLASLPPSFWESRREQKERLSAVIFALYNTPRLTREGVVQRPTSPVEMQRELEEVTRLSTPFQEHAAQATKPAKTPKAAGSGAKAVKAAAARSASAAADDAVSQADSDMAHLLSGELHPQDVLLLPVPKGLDARLVHRVQIQRSRRLRLEASIAIFRSELPRLEARLQCLDSISLVGSYSLSAVAPAMLRGIEEESALQRIRLQEDELFQQRRAATPAPSNIRRPPTSPV